ncbi:MAG: hypothetical protein ACYDCO_00920 [Armatimonadota bacterium]
MEMIWQQMISLPWGLTGTGAQYMMVMAVALMAGGVYMMIRDMMRHGKNVPVDGDAQGNRKTERGGVPPQER